MTIRQLKTLVAIADNKTFSAAADAVHVTHAAVSQQMQSLEAELGVPLFDRAPRTPELTPLAQQIVAKARTLIFDYDNLVPSVLADGGLQGTLTVGVMRTTLTGLIPQTVAALKAKYPALGLHIRTGLTLALMSDIKRGQLDAAVISRPHQLAAGVTFHALSREPMHLLVPPDEAETDARALLQHRPFIRFDRNAVVGALIDNWLVSHGISVSETMELDSPEAIASMVHAGLGVSILPDMAVRPPDPSPVRRLDLGPDAPHRTLGLIHTEDHPKMPALNELHATFAQVIANAAVTGAAG